MAIAKVAVPRDIALVVDRAIQVFGGKGVCADTPLAAFAAGCRILRIADGPDEVHLRTIFRNELAMYESRRSRL